MVEVKNDDVLKLYIEVNHLDVSANLVYVCVLAEDGSKQKTSFLTFNSSIMEELLQRYSKGEKLFWVNVYQGTIIQILNKPKEILAEEDKNKPLLLTCSVCHNPLELSTVQHSDYLLEQDREKKVRIEEGLDRACDSLIDYYRRLKELGKI